MTTIIKWCSRRIIDPYLRKVGGALLIALLCAPTPAAFAQSVLENLDQLGESIIFAPEGIAVDKQRLLLVTEVGLDYIHQILPNDTTTATMRIGVDGTGYPDGTFNGPIAIAFDCSGNMFVADLYNHRIQKFNSARVFQSTIVPASSLVEPLDVAVDSLGNIYVSDNLSAVKKFGSTGQLLNTISLPTIGPVGLGGIARTISL
jgi:sugar lactone lactonase YvrE